MMNPIPKLYEYLGVVLIVSLFGGFMYFKGWSGEHDKFVTFQANVAMAGKNQNAKTEQENKQHEQENKALVAGWIADRNHLSAQLDWMRNHPAGGGVVPKDAGSAGNADAQSGEPSRACQGTEFYYKALEDAQTVDWWYEWATKHGLPVEGH